MTTTKTTEIKINRFEILKKVNEILELNSNDPIKEMRQIGEALVAIADTLKPLSIHEARASMQAVALLQGFQAA